MARTKAQDNIAVFEPIDLDAGEEWSALEVPFNRPFKWQGVLHEKALVRCPTGEDIDAHIKGDKPREEFEALVAHLTGLAPAVLGKMFAGDRTRLFKTVGEFIGDTPPSSA